jgi:hypothetical protein
MVRTVLLGLLAVTSVAACASKEGSAKVEPGAPAGKVLEVTGKVSAVRGATTRALAVGETVAGDDVIETGADGHVAIELAHNLARWDLGPNKHERVADSLAWTLPKKDLSAKATEQDNSAAGRPAERSAADTTATAAPPPAAVAAPPPPTEAPGGPPAMQPSATPDVRRRETVTPAPAPRPPARAADRNDDSGLGLLDKGDVGGEGVGRAKGGGGGGGGDGGPAHAPRVAPKIDVEEKKPDVTRMDRPPTLQPPPPPPAKATVDPAQAALGVLRAHKAELAACAAGSALTITLHVAADGSVTVDVGKASATVHTCVTGVVKKLAFAAVKVDVSFAVAK